MSIELAPRRRESHALYITLLLLLLNLTLLSVQVEDPSGVMLLKKWLLAAGAPFIDLSAGASHAIKEFWLNYVWLHGARAENAGLKQAVERLVLRVRSLEQLEEENRRLRSLLAFREGTHFETLGARVIGRAPDFLSRIAYLDRGSADGVRADCPVVTAEGIVGRVILAAPHTSQVQLITNADASVGVVIERTGSPGVLRGTGGPLLEVGYISSTDDVAVGDLVVTSGLDRIYPKGLAVGKVVASGKGKSVFRDIRVEPSVDLLRIEQTLILMRSEPAPAPERRELQD